MVEGNRLRVNIGISVWPVFLLATHRGDGVRDGVVDGAAEVEKGQLQ